MLCENCHLTVPNDVLCNAIHRKRCGRNTPKENTIMEVIFNNPPFLRDCKRSIEHRICGVCLLKYDNKYALFNILIANCNIYIQSINHVKLHVDFHENNKHLWYGDEMLFNFCYRIGIPAVAFYSEELIKDLHLNFEIYNICDLINII